MGEGFDSDGLRVSASDGIFAGDAMGWVDELLVELSILLCGELAFSDLVLTRDGSGARTTGCTAEGLDSGGRDAAGGNSFPDALSAVTGKARWKGIVLGTGFTTTEGAAV